MFPANPWKDISGDGTSRTVRVRSKQSCERLVCLALSFLESLLALDSRRRLLINKVFLQPWLQVRRSCPALDTTDDCACLE